MINHQPAEVLQQFMALPLPDEEHLRKYLMVNPLEEVHLLTVNLLLNQHLLEEAHHRFMAHRLLEEVHLMGNHLPQHNHRMVSPLSQKVHLHPQSMDSPQGAGALQFLLNLLQVEVHPHFKIHPVLRLYMVLQPLGEVHLMDNHLLLHNHLDPPMVSPLVDEDLPMVKLRALHHQHMDNPRAPPHHTANQQAHHPHMVNQQAHLLLMDNQQEEEDRPMANQQPVRLMVNQLQVHLMANRLQVHLMDNQLQVHLMDNQLQVHLMDNQPVAEDNLPQGVPMDKPVRAHPMVSLLEVHHMVDRQQEDLPMDKLPKVRHMDNQQERIRLTQEAFLVNLMTSMLFSQI